MQLYICQRMFSWTDRYDVYDETGKARYEVKTEFFSFGHQIHVYDKQTGREVGAIHEKLLSLLPRFSLVVNGQHQGVVWKEFTLFRPRYHVDFRNWEVQGDLMGWDYRVVAGTQQIMSIGKKIFNWTDAYVLRYDNPANELPGLLLVLAIDAANCTDNK